MAFNINDYETVEVRLGKFIADYPDFMVHTELVQATETRFIVLAKIYRTCVDLQPFATGLAYETVSDRGVNSTSALENAETSAIGRSLANAGYAAKGKRPSQSEMAKVIAAETPKVIYGAPQSKSAAVETALRQSFAEDKKEPESVAWSIGDVVDSIGSKTPAAQECVHGVMRLKTGISKGGRPYYGYLCIKGCNPVWATMTQNGNWYFPSEDDRTDG